MLKNIMEKILSYEPPPSSGVFYLWWIMDCYIKYLYSPRWYIIGFIRAGVAEGKAVEYVIGDGEWVIVK